MKHLPAPDAREDLKFDAVFSAEETAPIRRGLVPQAMEDKWSIYFEDEWLRFHRSWTGVFVYALRLAETSSGSRVIESWVNRDPQQYKEKDTEYDRKMVRFLIDAFLLGKEASFPMPAGSKETIPGIVQHHLVGRAYPEKSGDD